MSAAGFKLPFAHFAKPNFLGETWNRQLFDYAIAHEDAFERSLIDDENACSLLAPQVRTSRLLADLGPHRAPLERAFRNAADEALGALKMALFDIARIEIELVQHGDGAFFSRHVDNSAGRVERVLSLVYYLFCEPRRFDGGELVIHSLIGSEAGGGSERIEPRNDLLIVFPSWAPHEVLPVRCPSLRFADARFAINCWLHRARRPSAAK